jgi:uncharacterized lipoprotein YmbA
MKRVIPTSYGARYAAVMLAVIATWLAGCSSPSTNGGTSSLPVHGVRGRDLGDGAATSGNLSSMEPNGNAADWSVWDARHPEE